MADEHPAATVSRTAIVVEVVERHARPVLAMDRPECARAARAFGELQAALEQLQRAFGRP